MNNTIVRINATRLWKIFCLIVGSVLNLILYYVYFILVAFNFAGNVSFPQKHFKTLTLLFIPEFDSSVSVAFSVVWYIGLALIIYGVVELRRNKYR